MPSLAGPTWTALIVAVVVCVVAAGLLLRYRALERAGTPLPPGAGGARLVGSLGIVTAAHVPGVTAGRVRVLGDEWTVADVVDAALEPGDTVRVEEVTGVRLVVARTVDVDGTTGDSAGHDESGSS